MTEWHPEPDQLVALALLDVSAEEEEHLVAHLGTCADCRAEYSAVEDSVQQALAATPAIAPPAGFSGRVLATMGIDAEAPSHRETGRRWRIPLLVAAAVLVGLIAGVGGTLAAMSLLGRPVSPSAQAPAAAALVTAAGETVGSASVTTLAGRDYLAVSVTRGRVDVNYECFIVGSDGSRTSGGSWTLTDEYGTGEASGAWLMPLSGVQPAAVELVVPSGKTWSTARF